jgi:hypothetical protein
MSEPVSSVGWPVAGAARPGLDAIRQYYYQAAGITIELDLWPYAKARIRVGCGRPGPAPAAARSIQTRWIERLSGHTSAADVLLVGRAGCPLVTPKEGL